MSLDAHRTWGRMGEYKPDPEVVGTNPCGETSLRDKDNCLLAALALPNFESVEEMKQATRVLYKVLKAVTQLHHPDPYTEEQMNRISRLGLSIGGWCQATDEQLTWPGQVYDDLHEFDIAWSKERGWNESVRLTSVKPDGTLGLLLGITPGIHGAYFSQGIRRMRIGIHDPLWRALQGRGHIVEYNRRIDGSIDETQMVVEFPIKFADNARVADSMSAVQQLDLCRFAQKTWADQSVSVTVTYRDEEIPLIREWMDENWHTLKTVSWLRYSGHGFVQAPYEPTSYDEYLKLDSAIDTSLPLIGGNDMDDLGCESGGACPVR
jgi:ribonucleoside-triphosphate reductase